MQLNQMASAIRNHVVDGLNGISNASFSLEQIEDEIISTTSTLLVTYIKQGVIDAERLGQRIDGIRVECQDISSNCSVASYVNAPHFIIPDINRAMADPIVYLGTMDNNLSIKVYYDRDFRYHKYRLATSKRPFAWVSSTPNKEGLYDVYLFNLGKYNNLQFISIDAIFDNPYDIYKTDYFDQFTQSEFYAPLFIQKEVITQLSNEYVNYYRKLHMAKLPNTQTN